MLSKWLSTWHPATHLLFFHIYAITYRGWRLYFGAAPLYGDVAGYSVVQPDEIFRGILYADLFLLLFAFASRKFHLRYQKKQTLRKTSRIWHQTLHPNLFWLVIAFCLPIGLYVFFFYRTGRIEDTGLANYYAMISFWPISCLFILVFYYGFRWYLLVPIIFYLLIVGLQGYHRFMVVLPLMYLLTLYLQRINRLWPNWIGITAIVAVLVFFPEWKYVGRAYIQDGLSAAIERAGQALDFSSERGERVENLLDQMAASLTMTDDRNRFYFGETYLYALTLPIPKSYWPEKPGLNQHVVDISTRGRPFKTEGRIIMLIGESYINFGILGVLIIPLVFGWFLSRWCVQATSFELTSLSRYVYLSLMITFINVFRDGITSMVMFGVFQNVPLVLVVALHVIFPKDDDPTNIEQQSNGTSSS